MCERLLLCSILIQIIRKNLHYGIVRYTKLTCEGVESNPGPRSYIIKKTINASHHQGHVRYGRSAGMQCTSNAYLAVIFSKSKYINRWKPFDLNYILEQGDGIFKDVDVNQALAVDELSLNISIEDVHISTKILVCESNLFVERNFFANFRNFTESERGNEAIFTCAGFSIAIIWWNNSLFVFDSHSRNADGYHDSNGKAILLEFHLVSSLNSYIKSFFENSTSISLETQYDFQCISVDIVENNKTEILTKIRLKREYVYHKSYYEENKKQKVDLKKQYYSEHKEQIKAYYMKKNDEILKSKISIK